LYLITPPNFYSCIDTELHKVESFTLKRVSLLLYEISGIEKAVGSIGLAPKEIKCARGMVDAVAGSFLTLENYVNINFMGFHKILKKHEQELSLTGLASSSTSTGCQTRLG
jgi:SPX domain protein involved in polyphosphate accumulation